MSRRRRSIPAWRVLGIGLILPALAGVGTATAAPSDRQAPSVPANLRVAATTAYTITLAWTPSKDNVGVTSYVVCCYHVNSQTIAAPASGMVYTAGVEAGRSFSLVAYARDAAGNWSKASNRVEGTTPRDTSAPSKPAVTVTDVGPTHVSLTWSSTDDSPNLWFTVKRDGLQLLTADKRTSSDFGLLEPETTYAFTVQARDWGGNSSPVSDPVVVTTEARDTTDTTAPTTPANLHSTLSMPDGETWLRWTQSTDDTTAQPFIRYDIFVNGTFDSSVVGFDRQVVYGTPLSFNTYTVVAVDESGNESAPASVVIDNR